jgi:hypothetical protein
LSEDIRQLQLIVKELREEKRLAKVLEDAWFV